jgi:hypothetical protein
MAQQCFGLSDKGSLHGGQRFRPGASAALGDLCYQGWKNALET